MLRVALGMGLLAALAGCAGHKTAAPAASRAALPARTAAPPAPPPVAATRALWELRAGLNVAALSCKGRGRASVAGPYARMLSRHKTLLAQAYSAEQRRHGGGFDRQQTRLYNRFSNQRDPARFCAAAAGVASRAAAMDSPTLARTAPALLREID